MLGGWSMSVSKARQRGRGALAQQPLIRALSLLREALALVDTHADAPELGARLQEVIDGLKSRID